MIEFYVSFEDSGSYEICNMYLFANDMNEAIEQAKTEALSVYKEVDHIHVYEVERMDDDTYEGEYVVLSNEDIKDEDNDEYIVTLYYLNEDGEEAEEEYRGKDEQEALYVYHDFASDLTARSAHHGVELRLELTHNGDIAKEFKTYL